jgi:hypothetical protein
MAAESIDSGRANETLSKLITESQAALAEFGA